MVTRIFDSKSDLHEYRASFKEWIFDAVRKAPEGHWRLLTLTFADQEVRGSVVTEHSPAFVTRTTDRWLNSLARPTVHVVESGRRSGRAHAHALVLDACDKAQHTPWCDMPHHIAVWQREYGFVVDHVVTDLMGAVSYLFKAFGPESHVNFSEEVKKWLSTGAEDTANTTGDTDRVVAGGAGAGVPTGSVGVPTDSPDGSDGGTTDAST